MVKAASANKFDEAFLRWFSGCYRLTAATMPDEQRLQIECAFYAGASATLHCERDAVALAIYDHLMRIRQRRRDGNDQQSG